MTGPRWRGALVAVLLAFGAGPALADPAFELLLEQADSVRTADPHRFGELVAQLEARQAAATPAQRERLRYFQAYRLAYAGNYAAAITAANSLFVQADDVGVKYRAGLLAVNGHAATRDFVSGLRMLEQTQALAPRIRDRELVQIGLGVSGIFYNQLGQYELGRQSAEAMLANTPDARSRCFAGNIRLEALFNLETVPDDATIDAVVADCEAIGEALSAQRSRYYLARKWADDGEGDKAIALLEQHLPAIRATRYPRLIGEVEALLAELHFARKDGAAAERYAHGALEHGGDVSYALPTVVAHRILYEMARQRGDAQQALEHYLRYAEADKAYLDDVNAREFAYQNVRQETQRKTQTIELLNRQNKVLQLQERGARLEARNTQLAVLLLVVLLASIGYWAYKVKRVQVSFRRLAETDALTSVSNRHHFTLLANEALAHAKRTGDDLGFVMFDIDNFKIVNDCYGHATGDWVLREIADVCRALGRRQDNLSRIGGEEFAILLPGCRLADAERIARACCERIASIDTTPSGYVFKVSASFGVTTAALANHEFSKLLAQADAAMYLAKEHGRNRVVVHADPAAVVALA